MPNPAPLNKNGCLSIHTWLQANGDQAPLLIIDHPQNPCRPLISTTLKASWPDHFLDVLDTTIIDTDDKTITIEQVRGLIKQLTLTPVGQRRLAIIYNAHRLSLPAANALLKTLEEAPPYARFLLVTAWPSRLPATILSRCVRLLPERNPPNKAAGTDHNSTDLERLRQYRDGHTIAPDDVATVASLITYQLKTFGPSPALRLATARLVEYYRVKEKGGNEKLAREVLSTYVLDILQPSSTVK